MKRRPAAEPKTLYSFRMSESQVAWLNAEAARRGATVSEILRALVEQARASDVNFWTETT